MGVLPYLFFLVISVPQFPGDLFSIRGTARTFPFPDRIFMNVRGVFPGAEPDTRVLPHFSGIRRTSQHQNFPDMSKRTIDLTNDEESTQRRTQRAINLDSDEEDGMQVDQAPTTTSGSTTALARTDYQRHVRAIPGIMAPHHSASFLVNPAMPGSSVVFQEEQLARPGLPEHMFNNVFTDEVVLTSVLIFKFFADFPPEITELLCDWITRVTYTKRVLLNTSDFGKDHDNPFFVIDPKFPEDLAVISASVQDYGNYRLPARDRRFRLLSLVCPFELFIGRVFLNILQLQRAEMTLRETERRWRLDLAKTISQSFPGQKILITTEMPSVQGAHCRVQVPSVCFFLADTYGNSIRPFSFVGLKLPPHIEIVFVTAVAHPDFRCFTGSPTLWELSHDGSVTKPRFYSLQNALRGEPNEKGTFSPLCNSRGLLLSTHAPTNARLTFHVRNENFTEEDDELIFKFVVKQKD